MSLSVLPIFSSKSFIVSGLIFRSLIHFQFIFVYGVRKCSNFLFFFTRSCLVFPAPFIEEAVFAPLYILASFVKNKVPIGAWVYFWAFYLNLMFLSGLFTVTFYRKARHHVFQMFALHGTMQMSCNQIDQMNLFTTSDLP